MLEYSLPQTEAKLASLKQNWLNNAKHFAAHFTNADFPEGVKIVGIKRGNRVISGLLTDDSVVAYDQEGRMVANWESFSSPDIAVPTAVFKLLLISIKMESLRARLLVISITFHRCSGPI